MDVDAIHSFSGISEELLRSLAGRPIVKSVVRGSAHIRTQAQLLAEERARAGQDMDQPSEWRVAREEREYEMADVIFVLSSFAKNSFEAHGVRPDKIRELHLGSELTRFRANADDIERRCRRIESGEPLRVLTVGNFSYQKGALDLIAIAQTLGDRMKFKVVGKVESNELIIQAGDKIEFIARQPQFSLPSIYREADIFVFPTIQDGYAVVLAQAQAGGLPILATANCAAPEIVSNNENGWVLPIRDPAAFIEKLRWCDSNRKDLARMVRSAFDAFKPRDWSHVATDLIDIYQELVPTVSGS
jgi:glycosyltransferase involved in cell wall biosynthesis